MLCFHAAQTGKHFNLRTQNVFTNIFCVPDTKFVSATTVARAGKRETFLSATMCPQLCVLVCQGLRAGSHFDISISISRHTQTQYDVDNQRLLLEISLIKNANYLHRTASAYVGLCLCLCQSVNKPLRSKQRRRWQREPR